MLNTWPNIICAHIILWQIWGHDFQDRIPRSFLYLMILEKWTLLISVIWIISAKNQMWNKYLFSKTSRVQIWPARRGEGARKHCRLLIHVNKDRTMLSRGGTTCAMLGIIINWTKYATIIKEKLSKQWSYNQRNHMHGNQRHIRKTPSTDSRKNDH